MVLSVFQVFFYFFFITLFGCKFFFFPFYYNAFLIFSKFFAILSSKSFKNVKITIKWSEKNQKNSLITI